MKRYWTGLFSLLLMLALAGCGSEQFGSVPQTKQQDANPLEAFEQGSCSNHTLIKPQVDVLYLVDNSSSNLNIKDSIKDAIQGTISSISDKFDYRIIGTKLLSNETNNFQVLAKNPKKLPAAFETKKVTSPADFNFFDDSGSPFGANEPGTKRLRDFLTAHQADGLFRKDAYLFIVFVSNGRDTDLEVQMSAQNLNETVQVQPAYNDRLAELKALKSYFNSIQFRFFSLTQRTGCDGGKSSGKSYVQMSKDLYLAHESPVLTDQGGSTWPDHYDLCSSSISSVFTSVNNTIKQVVLPHKYKYWPITFTESENLDVSKIKIFKSSGENGTSVAMTSGWSYLSNPSNNSYNTRIEPSLGEPSTARHLIEFAPGSEIVYPDCVEVTSTTNLEYFQYIVLDQPAKIETIVVKINGQAVANANWSYQGYASIPNIKVAHNGYSDLPAAPRSGYMIKLKSSANYYKSGDKVEVNYLPDEL